MNHDSHSPADSAPTIWISGGSRGIGRAIACALAAPGQRLVIQYHTNQTAAEETVAMLTARQCRARAVCADTRNPEAIRQAIADTADWGPVGVLVANSGINYAMPIPLMSPAKWREIIETNLDGAFLLTKELARQMIRQRHGRIVYISSAAALTGDLLHAAYSASKAALIGFAKSAAREFAASGITVNVVAPGPVDTDMTAKLAEAQRRKQTALIPLARFGAPEEVAAAVRFLVSDRAAYITGQVLCVDGGLCMKGQP